MNSFIKNFLFALLILFFLSTVFALFSQSTEREKKIPLNQVIQDIEEEKIDRILISDNDLEIFYKDGKKALSKKEPEISLSQIFISYGIKEEKLRKVAIEEKEKTDIWGWLGPILYILPTIFLFFFFWLIFRQAKTGAGQVFDFTRARARIFGVGGQLKEKITFKDVAGLKEAKQELMEVVDFLKNPKKYLQMGAKIPRGVILIGAPGTGKTMLAKAVSNEANVPFFSISGSEFIELFVGVGASRIRNLFDQARKVGRAIIFIDEIDSIGKIRGVGVTGGHEEREQTLNQLLAEMDGIGTEENIVVVAATNQPEYLDPALLRPGRFDRRIVLDLPDINEREAILKIHCRGKPLALNVNLREVAERTPGFSGADLANVINEAAILAARRNKAQIFQEEILESIEKVLLGPERKSHILSKKEKEIAAYHEAGHALMASFLPEAEEVRKVSIVARGLAAGYTLKMPAEERKIKTKSQFLAELSTLLGGYVAEKIKFGEITTGASNDLKNASELARKLVKEYGMSALGPISFGKREELIFLGGETAEQRNYSEKIAVQIDKEVEKFIKNAKNQAEKILNQKRKLLEKVAQTLIEKETIEKEEFEKLIKGKKEIKKAPKLGSLKVRKIR
ncbi:MAG: cell division protein FtsH [Candidatus Nealsonbacteria bacterium CG_4_10_14_0_8_um_filter_35_10]|uniref:ATP-dependent zinc metalloprotease FtsH n=2 Tax=Candidatus Nealsoniibacteriota TaxID=1817911 RepID=A0A2M7R8A3_9BACT|nr:MAG: cell division protein FtsH [Parcubacteria group bacterium CG1_02_36_42]PIY91021.1 MAG: cell division protein FtsH [Candidatus Nealsonbacteria bacterium CG_4_10_14_0_8_um_filter_35_10]PJB99617.1 MAG: cell division protein FtsH [Candidatus Nealsonbacteria bacterium CG_4_9_14_0_8_um_filter_35_12]